MNEYEINNSTDKEILSLCFDSGCNTKSVGTENKFCDVYKLYNEKLKQNYDSKNSNLNKNEYY
jgi:hypothetical protein